MQDIILYITKYLIEMFNNKLKNPVVPEVSTEPRPGEEIMRSWLKTKNPLLMTLELRRPVMRLTILSVKKLMLHNVDRYHLDAQGGGAYIYPRVKVVSQTRDKLICYLNGEIVKHYYCGYNFREKKECMKWELKLKIKITRFKVGSNKVIFQNLVKKLCLGDYSCFPCLHQSGGRQ